MRGLAVHDVRTDQRNEVAARQQAVYGPDAGIARFESVVARHTHCQSQAPGPDTLDLADMWLRRTRTFIARRLIRCGFKLANWATVIAPWIEEENRDRNT